MAQEGQNTNEQQSREDKVEAARQVQDANTLRIQELGEVLGLHEDFIRDVQERGAPAIVDRGETVDETGAHALLLAMSLEYGAWLDQVSRDREKAPSVDEKVDIIARTGRRYGVDPHTSMFVLGALDEQFEEAASQIREFAISQKMSDRKESLSGRGSAAGKEQPDGI